MRDQRGEAAQRLTAVLAVRRPGAVRSSKTVGGWVPAGDVREPWADVGEVGQVAEVGEAPSAPARTVRPVAAVAAAVVAVVVCLVAWLHAQDSGEAVQLAPRGSRSSASAASTAPSGAAPSGAAPSGATAFSASSPSPSLAGVVVDVEGRVRRPGLQHLPPGSRVADAVRAAGGATAGAVLTALNLARLLADGEQVAVPGPGDPPVGAAAGAGAGAGAGVSGGSASGPLDLNAATPAGLDALPGVGPVLAERIVAWRAQHGRFTSVDELTEVPGIGPKALERLRPLVRV